MSKATSIQLLPHRSPQLTRSIIGTLIGVVALWWAMRGIEMSTVLRALATVSPTWIAVSLLSVMAVAVAKTARWGVLYAGVGPQISFWELFSVLMAAQMINIVIPIRVGELTRIGLMKQTGQHGATTFSTIVIEKTLDLVALGLVAVSLVTLTVAPAWLRESAGSILLIGLTFAIGLVLVWWLRDWLEQSLARLLALGKPLPEVWQRRVLSITQTMLEALGTLTNWPSLSRALFWTIIAWLLPVLTSVALFVAFGLQLPVSTAVVMMLALSFSYLVPSLPGLVGVRQMIAIVVLGHYGVTQPVASGFGIVLNVVTVAPLIILGSWAIWPRTRLVFGLYKRSVDAKQ